MAKRNNKIGVMAELQKYEVMKLSEAIATISQAFNMADNELKTGNSIPFVLAGLEKAGISIEFK